MDNESTKIVYYASITLLWIEFTLRFRNTKGTVLGSDRERMLDRASEVRLFGIFKVHPVIKKAIIGPNGVTLESPIKVKSVSVQTKGKGDPWQATDFIWVMVLP